MAKNKKKTVDSKYIGVIKGVISAVIMCVLAILIYAVILKTFSMNSKSIPYFNQIIKIAGIIIASYYSARQGGMLTGLMGGVTFILVTFLLFSLINGGIGSIPILISDIVMGAVIGLIFAAISTRLSMGKEQQGAKR